MSNVNFVRMLGCCQLLILKYDLWEIKLDICLLIHCHNLKFNLSIVNLLLLLIFPNLLPKLVGPLYAQNFLIFPPETKSYLFFLFPNPLIWLLHPNYPSIFLTTPQTVSITTLPFLSSYQNLLRLGV